MRCPARFLISAAFAAKMLIHLLEKRRLPSRATCREYLSLRCLQRKQIIAQGMMSQDPRSGRKRGRGQPTKFREEYVEQVRALCKAGLRDEEIAAYLGVSSRSLHRWQDRWPQFFEARELKHQPTLRQVRKPQWPR
jgi:DNA-binding transcriptional regulator YiaG